MRRELEVITDIYGPNERLVKKGVIYRKMFELNDIEVEEYISDRGTISKKYCGIVLNNKYYKINKSYEYVRNLVGPTEVKGLMSKSRRK